MEKKTRKKSTLLTIISVIIIIITIITSVAIISVYFLNEEPQEEESSNYAEERPEIVTDSYQEENNEILFIVNDLYINRYGYIKRNLNNTYGGILLEGINISYSQEKIDDNLFENLSLLYTSLDETELIDKVTKVDISDMANISLYIESKDQIIQLGDLSDLSLKLNWAKEIMEEENESGTINVEDVEEVYFREEV